MGCLVPLTLGYVVWSVAQVVRLRREGDADRLPFVTFPRKRGFAVFLHANTPCIRMGCCSKRWSPGQ